MKPISQHRILEKLENKIIEALIELSLIKNEKFLKAKNECHVTTFINNKTYNKNDSLQKILRSPDKRKANEIKRKSWGTTSFLFILSNSEIIDTPQYYLFSLN